MVLPKITRESYFKGSVLFLLFLLLAFDRDMAMIYILIIVGDFLWWRFDKNITFPVEKRTDNRLGALLEAGIAAAAFFIFSTLAITAFAVEPLPAGGFINAILQLYATSTPVLQGNILLTIVGWGILIPVIETIFFNGTLLEGLATVAEKQFNTKISFKKFSFALIMVVLTVATLFTLFHLTAKNLASIPLLITFIFSVISSVLVIRNGEIKQAILLHIIINSMAVLSTLNLLPFI